MRVPERNRDRQLRGEIGLASQNSPSRNSIKELGGGGVDRPRAVGSRSLDIQIWKSGIHVWRMCVNGQIADHCNKTVRSQES